MRSLSTTRKRALHSGAAVLFLLALPFGGWGPGPTGADSASLAAQQIERFEPAAGYVLPPAEIQDFFRRDTHRAVLDHPDPSRNHFLVPLSTELSTLERMAETTYRLAEVELRPGTDRLWHLDTYGIHGFRIFSLADRTFREFRLPDEAFASDFMWSPAGDRIAFLAHLREATQLWTAEVATGQAGPASQSRVMATIGTRAGGQGSRPSDMLQWTPEGSLITLLVPSERGAEPAVPAVPSSPDIRRTRDRPVSTRTLPNLLENHHDADLFEHYTTSRIAELVPGSEPRMIGEAGMYTSISLSPDGRHILATKVERPFSFIVAWGSFPRRTVILDRTTGEELLTVSTTPLRDGSDQPDAASIGRDVAWRPDGAGLHYQRNAGGGRDEIVVLEAPFDTAQARRVATAEGRLSNLHFDLSGAHGVATASRGDSTVLVHFDLTRDDPSEHVVTELQTGGDPLELSGSLVTGTTSNGLPHLIISTDGNTVYLEGPGYQDDFRPRPFVDAVAIADGAIERIFEGSRDSWDRPLVPLDPDFTRMTVQRESKTDFPDSYLWERGASLDSLERLTNNVDPFPELTAAERIDFSFVRRDGVEVQARLSLPIDYVPGTQVPAIYWTYPREYTDAQGYERAAIRGRNHNAFHHVTWLRWSDLWLSQGYAVVDPDIPIIGENYNDTYMANMVDAMYGAIRATDDLGFVDIERIGHGGHSYGAFATVNFLAHSPFFKAGIAGHGAYNRTLTPAGFQSERRTIWEAPHTYAAISPFFHAHQIESPLLMYHGADDNNTGTWPIQSERLIHALTNLGKDAVLYRYPFESHTPRAIENNLDMWARWIEWFDHYVKNAPATSLRTTDTDVSEQAGGR